MGGSSAHFNRAELNGCLPCWVGEPRGASEEVVVLALTERPLEIKQPPCERMRTNNQIKHGQAVRVTQRYLLHAPDSRFPR